MFTSPRLTHTPFDPAPYAERVEALLAAMTPAEKIGQLHLADPARNSELTDCNIGSQTKPESIEDKIRRGGVGAMMAPGKEAAARYQEIAVKESRLGIPILFGCDVIHGHRLIFPVPLGEAAAWDPDMIEKAEAVAARDAAEEGINWVYAPMIDLCRDPRWGRVAEGAGEDPLLGSLIAQAKVRGLQTVDPETGYPYVAACFKHYCGYGLAQGGRDYEEADVSPRTLFMDYMKPYAAAVDAGAFSAMSSFNVLNGEPVSGSRYYLNDVLREKYGFGGFVVSDYGAIEELIHHRVAADRRASAVRALCAGVDMDMGSSVYTGEGEALYREDPVFAAAADESVRRILSVKFALGLFEHPHRRAFPDRIASDKDARALARELARHCMVLLKNGDGEARNKPLPLTGGEKLFLTGPLADDEADMSGAWGAYRPDTNVYSVKKAIDEAGIPYDSFAGCPFRAKYCFDDTDDGDFAEGIRRAAACDVIVFVCGERSSWSGENRGRVSITLPELQMRYLRELKKLGKPIVSVLMCGRAMACAELAQLSDALLLAWHAGTEAGHAVCDCLYGRHNPCGRLPITFPYYTGQIPYYHSWLSSGRDRNDLIRYKDGENGPLYPFGYGLSYADVAYRSVEILNPALASDKEELHVRVALENVSDVPAWEVVQAYYQDVVSSLATPERKLCGFTKVYVPAHGTAEAELSIPAARFALMTEDLREVVEPGEFRLFVGHDSTCTEERRFTVN